MDRPAGFAPSLCSFADCYNSLLWHGRINGKWQRELGSNQWHANFQSAALPTELSLYKMALPGRIELPFLPWKGSVLADRRWKQNGCQKWIRTTEGIMPFDLQSNLVGHLSIWQYGTGKGTRTPTPKTAADFKSAVSAISPSQQNGSGGWSRTTTDRLWAYWATVTRNAAVN